MLIPRWVVAILAGFACLGGLAILAHLGVRILDAGFCSNDVISTAPAPGGLRQAIVFVRNCGATTRYGTNVSVLSAGDNIGDEAGSIFLVDEPPFNTVLRNRIGGPRVEVRWLGADSLLVSYASGVEIHRQVLVEQGVHVRYATLQ
jgi:hypothetical protein